RGCDQIRPAAGRATFPHPGGVDLGRVAEPGREVEQAPGRPRRLSARTRGAAAAGEARGIPQRMSDTGSFHGRPLRVLHGWYEIAGQGMALAAGLNALGCEAHSLAYRVDWDGRRPDFVVELDPMRGPLARAGAMLGAFARWAPQFDLFHFHFGTSFFGSTYHRAAFPGLADVPLLKAMRKRVVFHFHGCEVRNRERMLSAHR